MKVTSHLSLRGKGRKLPVLQELAGLENAPCILREPPGRIQAGASQERVQGMVWRWGCPAWTSWIQGCRAEGPGVLGELGLSRAGLFTCQALCQPWARQRGAEQHQSHLPAALTEPWGQGARLEEWHGEDRVALLCSQTGPVRAVPGELQGWAG